MFQKEKEKVKETEKEMGMEEETRESPVNGERHEIPRSKESLLFPPE